MLENCARTCEVCAFSGPDETAVSCKDKDPDQCAIWGQFERAAGWQKYRYGRRWARPKGRAGSTRALTSTCA